MENLTKLPIAIDSLHQQFLTLGRERNKITYKLLALLPKIYKEKVYEAKGFATIYEYAGKLAGLSHSTVEKALKLEEKLKDKPLLQKAIETQGIHKVSIIANLATSENEKMFADKVENMSKPALQQFSKEFRGKIQTTWNIEMDEEMMTMFLKLKKSLGKFGSELSNKEAMRRILKMIVDGNMQSKKKEERSGTRVPVAKNSKPQTEAKRSHKILGENQGRPGQVFSKKLRRNFEHHVCEKFARVYKLTRANLATVSEKIPAWVAPASSPKITRYIPLAQKRLVLASTNNKCSHENCHNPAQIFHHQIRFSESKNHDSIISLCKIHHEFAHNGITEPMTEADQLYRKYRQVALR